MPWHGQCHCNELWHCDEQAFTTHLSQMDVIMRKSLLLLPFIAAAALGAMGPESRTPVVVELFTSQGCSSCPPADAFLEDLSKQPDVIAIARPVTYWDKLGWPDTLAREENTDLQRIYATKGREGSGVYTPQIVVQGLYGTVGSRRGEVTQFIGRARKDVAAAIAVRPGLVAVAGKGAPAEVKLLDIKSSAIVRIGRGENGGRTVRYVNIVMAERTLGQWDGGAKTFPVLPGRNAKADKQLVIAQKAGGGPILAAAWI
jgi:hypothetical protein